MNSGKNAQFVIGLAVVAGTATSVLGQASFQPLADSVNPPRTSHALGVSGDGQVVVGWVQEPGTTTLPLPARWPVVSGPPEVVTDRDGQPIDGAARAVSLSGDVVVGDVYSAGRRGFTWSGDSVDWFLAATANDVTADGELMCGMGYGSIAATWHSGEEPGFLPMAKGFEISGANGISAGGDFIAGYVQRGMGDSRAALWRRVGLGYEVSVLPTGQSSSIAYTMSPDGTVVGGYHQGPAGAAYWTRGVGPLFVPTQVGVFSGVFDVSRRGARMVGSVGSGSQVTAWIWDRQGIARSLKELLETEHGLDLTGWRLISANAISDDGTVIVGSGINPQGATQGWRVGLAISCASDWNFDGVVNSTDVSDFINEWFLEQSEPTFASDVDGNGVVNSTDVSEYINGWFMDAASCG